MKPGTGSAVTAADVAARHPFGPVATAGHGRPGPQGPQIHDAYGAAIALAPPPLAAVDTWLRADQRPASETPTGWRHNRWSPYRPAGGFRHHWSI
jgi:hypothetical protein